MRAQKTFLGDHAPIQSSISSMDPSSKACNFTRKENKYSGLLNTRIIFISVMNTVTTMVTTSYNLQL